MNSKHPLVGLILRIPAILEWMKHNNHIIIPMQSDCVLQVYPVHNWGDNFDLFDKGGKA